MSGHTPGPWRVGGWSGRCTKAHHGMNHPGPRGDDPCVYSPEFVECLQGIAAANGTMVVSVSFGELAMTADDAWLIAAAPDLLALLIELTDIEGPLPGTQKWYTKVMAAIAKATGAA